MFQGEYVNVTEPVWRQLDCGIFQKLRGRGKSHSEKSSSQQRKRQTLAYTFKHSNERRFASNLHFYAVAIYYLVLGLGESSGFDGYLRPPSWL